MSDIPAGWQPDPRGRHEYRYWDGTQWTDHVSDHGEVSEDPVADSSPAEAQAAATKVQPVAAEPPAAEPTRAAEPEPTPVEPEPEPEPAPAAQPAFHTDPVVEHPPAVAGAPAASATPPGAAASTAQTDAKAAAQDMLHSKSADLATILSVIAPGSGHFYMGAANAVPVGVGLLVATAVAVVLAYMSFLLFIIGFVIWLGAAAFAVNDLSGDVEAVTTISLAPQIVGMLLIGAGVAMIVGLFLPFYTGDGGTISGLEFMTIIDLVVLLVGAAAIVSGAAALGLGPVTAAELPRQLPIVVAVGGAAAGALVLFRLLVIPHGGDGSIGRGFGGLLCLDAAILIALANIGILRSLTTSPRPTS